MSGEDESLTDDFDALVTRHQASVFRLARLLTRSEGDAEDVLQQTFLSAWGHRAQFRAESSVRTWLLTITRNTALTARGRQSREPLDPIVAWRESAGHEKPFAPGAAGVGRLGARGAFPCDLMNERWPA